MAQKNNQRSLIPQFDPNKEIKQTYINKDALLMDGWRADKDDANVFVSIRFVQHDYECFSSWDKMEMKGFWG